MHTVVITGSTRGIGLGLAEAFLQRGCQVVISGRRQATADEVLSALAARQPGAHIVAQACDVTQFEQVQALWDTAQAKLGRVDLWVNNAGAGNTMQKLWELPPATLESLVNTNLTGTLFGCQVAIRGMAEQGGGHIYNMEGFGSDGAVRVGLAPYGTTKYAIRYLTKALAKETADLPVKISTISPGMVTTDLLLENVEPGQREQAKRIFNILADRVETVTPWLVDQMLSNERSGARIAWLTKPKIYGRFLLAPFRKRDLFADSD